MPPRLHWSLPFLRYILQEYDAGHLTFALIPQMLLVTFCTAGVAEIWATLLLFSLTPEESQQLGGSLTSLYWRMITGGLSLALLYALSIAGLLLYRRRRPNLFPKAQKEEIPPRWQRQEGL